jgi:glycosyltransferase involved in cell wall biosynthesis
MRKLLYIITQGEQGGAQKNVVDTANHFDSLYDVTVATGVQKSEKDKWIFENINSEINKHKFNNLLREINLMKDFSAILEIYKYVKQNKIDIVHLHSSKAGVLGSIAARCAGAKVVYTVHGFVFKEPMNVLKKAFYICAELLASLFVDKYILVSKQDEMIGRQYKIIRGNKNNANGVVIYNGIKTGVDNLKSKSEARELLKLDKNKKIIGSIANLYKTKGLEYLIAAVKIVKDNYVEQNKKIDWQIVIVGEGEERAGLERRIREADLQEEFLLLGRVPDVSSYLRAFDLFALTSVKEGLPYCLIEATLAELPILATRVGGIVEMSQYIEMNLVGSKDVGQISDKLIKFLDKDEAGTYESKFNDIFSIDKMVENIEICYNSI